MFFCVSFFLRVLESLTRTCVLSKNKSLFFLDAIKWVRKTSFMFCRTPPLDWEWRQPFGFTKLNGNRPKRKIDGLKRLFGSIRAIFDWNKGKRCDWTQPSQQPPLFQFRATKHIHIHVCVCLYLVCLEVERAYYIEYVRESIDDNDDVIRKERKTAVAYIWKFEKHVKYVLLECLPTLPYTLFWVNDRHLVSSFCVFICVCVCGNAKLK